MNLHRTGSSLGSLCCTAVAWWVWALVGVACGDSEALRSLEGAAPNAAPPPGGVAPGNTNPEAVNAGTPAAGGPVDTSAAAAASESPNVSGLEPPAGEDEAEGATPATEGEASEGEASEEAPATPEDAAPEDVDPTPPADVDPADDENLRFILEDGFETTYFAVHCSALGEDGTEIDGDTVTELPVGGGFILQCNLDSLPSRSTTDVLSAADEPWCALGELTSFETGGDDRLEITLVSPPDSPSPTLIARRDGEPISLQLASAFGAPLWPVWLVTTYDATEVARAQQGKLCDEVFGL